MEASNILGTYSPESVQVVLSNAKFTHTMSGFTDGTFINIARVIPHATLYTGADASNVRVVRAVRNCDITFTLHQSSESNDVLSQLLRLDEDSRSGEDIFTMTIKDSSGRTVASSGSVFIGTIPEAGFGTDISDRDWLLHAINVDIVYGGNGKMTPAGFSTVNSLGGSVAEDWASL